MDRTHLALSSIAWTIALVGAVVLPAFAGMATAAVANDEVRPDSYAIEQGDRCIPLSPIGDATEDVEAYYDYRSGSGDEFSSHGTTDVQAINVSQLYVYRGSNGDSLLVLHDALGDDGGGGAVSMTFAGVPENGTWAVLDDDYDAPDDQYDTNGSEHVMHWMWAPGRTDGGGLLGIAELGDESIEIDADFGEDSWAATERNTTWPYADDDVSWAGRNGEGTLVPIEKDEPVTFRRGDCPSEEPPQAQLTASTDTPHVDENVTLDASGSTDDDGVLEYRWDLSGNGSIDAVTDGPTYETRYAHAGTVDPRVEVVDRSGLTATATTTIEVQPAPSVTAVADVPATARAGQPVTLDGTNSTGNEPIVAYRWTVNGTDLDGTDNATVQHTFPSPGTVDVTLTVVGESGVTDSTNASVEVIADEPPNATLDAPATATAGDSITLDASGSTDDHDIVEYRWDLDGDGAIDDTTTSPRYNTTYETADEHAPSVTVVDDADQTDRASATVNVSLPTFETNLSANRTAVETGEPVAFTASATPTELVEGYEFDFDDGESATGNRSVHAYDQAGEYTVTLTATSTDGRTRTATVLVDIDASEPTDGDGGSGDDGGSSDDGGSGDDGGGAGDGDSSGNDDGGGAGSGSGGDGGAGSGGGGGGGAGGGGGGGAAVAPQPSPSIEVVNASLNRTSVAAGEAVLVTTTLENSGDGEGTERLGLTVNGSVVEPREVDVPADTTRQVGIDYTAGEPGAFALAVNGTSAGTLTVRSSLDLVSLVDPSAPVAVGEPARIEAVVGNPSNRSTSAEVSLRVEGNVSTVRTVTVGAGENRTLAFSPTFESPGEYVIGVLGTNRTVVVIEDDTGDGGSDDAGNGGAQEPGSATATDVVDLVVSDQSVAVGERATIEATVANDGAETASVEVALTVDGNVSSVRTVDVPAGESRTVAFERAFGSAGEYDVGVRGANESVTVAAVERTGTTGGDSGSDDEDDGTGNLLVFVSVGVLALVGTILGLSRWMEP